MHDRGNSVPGKKNPKNNSPSRADDQHRTYQGGNPCADFGDHRRLGDWMPGHGRGGRRAMMMRMMMSMDPSDMPYWMDRGRFGFGGRGDGRGRGGWFGFGCRGRGCWGGRGRHGRRWMFNDDEIVASMSAQMRGCQLNDGCKRDGSGSSSDSPSSTSESDDDQQGIDDDVQGEHQIDGESGEVEEKCSEQSQKRAVKSSKGEKEQSGDECECFYCHHRRRHWFGHLRRDHGRRDHGDHRGRHHFRSHHSMVPPPHPWQPNRFNEAPWLNTPPFPPMHPSYQGFYHPRYSGPPPHPHCFDTPPFHPMHHSHHNFRGYHGDRHMSRKFFKKSMKMWFKTQKKAWKHQQGDHQPVPRSDGDEAATSSSDNDHTITDIMPPPWVFFLDDHDGCRFGRRRFSAYGKLGMMFGKRHRRCNGDRPRHEEDNGTPETTTKRKEGDVGNDEEV